MNKKALKTTVASLALVGVIGVGATLAYLTTNSNELTNTFTVGDGFEEIGDTNQNLILHEKWIDGVSKGNEYNDKTEKRTMGGNDYKDVKPADVLTKDPKLTISKDSVDSYLYIKVTGLDALAKNGFTTTINTSSWTKVTEEIGLDGVYRYTGSDLSKGYVESTNDNNPETSAAIYTTESALFDNITVLTDKEFTDETVINNVNLSGVAVQATYMQNGVETVVDVDTANEQAITKLQ